jgi:hypothetical protein
MPKQAAKHTNDRKNSGAAAEESRGQLKLELQHSEWTQAREAGARLGGTEASSEK